jgi:hypothetical protein
VSGDIIVGAAKNVRDWMDWATLIITGVGVIVVAFYTGVALWQAILTRRAIQEARVNAEKALEETRGSNAAIERSNEIAERNLILGQRSCVVVSELEEPDLTQGAVRIVIENVGRIPATNVRGQGWVIVHGRALPDPLPAVQLGPAEPSKAVLAAGKPVSGRLEIRGNRSDLHSLLAKREHCLIAYVQIEYSDWFNEQRTTMACWQYFEGDGWVVASKHNSVG